ncbi:MAG TPA: sigma-54 dependent transcriptional regulator [Acidobacteriaceae bacterium]|nr:sigma-54 dependent transcriptional regulator [Acidobacteriaceae bacterium]
MTGMEHSGNRLHVLVLEEDDATRSACVEIATQRGFSAEGLADAADAQELLGSHTVDLLLMELKASRRQGMQLLEEVKALRPDTAIIVMTSSSTIGSAVEAMRGGATDYLTKPFLMEELGTVLERAAQQRQVGGASRTLRERLRSSGGAGNLVGRSPEMDKLYRILAKVAQSHHPALIAGEPGTGKEMVARTIHAQSENASQPFLTVDCGAFAPELIEHELFGYVKGAFPGALRNAPGVLASAERGTVFLDEIGQLTPDLQGKLLRVLQEKEIRPAGATHRIPLHARILAASSVDLAAAVTKGSFRKDLYYRLNVVTLRIPALRERRSDIPLLATHFLDRMSRESGESYTLSDDALRSMMDYDWPQNVRELEGAIERACTMASGPVIHMGDLPTQLQNHELELRREASSQMQKAQAAIAQPGATPRVMPLAELEKQAILSTIRQLKGDKLLAARLLGIGKTTLYRKLKEYGLSENVSLETLEPMNGTTGYRH